MSKLNLTDGDKAAIVAAFQTEENKAKVGRMFGVSARTVGRIIEETKEKALVEVEVVIQEELGPVAAVGDLIQCNEGVTCYYYTNRNVICVVTKVQDVDDISDKITVKIVSGGDVDGREWKVNSKDFSKIGEDILLKVVEEDYSVDEVEITEEASKTSYPETTFTGTSQVVTLSHKGFVRSVDFTHTNFDLICAAIMSGSYDNALAMMDVTKAIEAWGNGVLEIKDGVVLFKGDAIHNNLSSRIISLMGEGDKGFEKLANFLTNLMETVSFDVLNELYDFLKHDDIEFTDDGGFYAYKGVSMDFKDKYTGTIDNSVGASPSIPRNQVDPDRRNECSNGLHVCALHYLGSGMFASEKVVKVKVFPQAVVAIPRDYQYSKMRLTGYEVVEDVTDTWRGLQNS